MASLTITPDGVETIRNETLGTAGNVRIVILPERGRYSLLIKPRATALKYISAAVLPAEDAAIGATPYITIPIEGVVIETSEMDRTDTSRRFGLACANSSEVVELLLQKVQ